MKIVCWNCRKATARSGVWDYLCELDPDVALLQEVTSLAPAVASRWQVAEGIPVTKGGTPQRFRTVLLARGEIEQPFTLRSRELWVQDELARFAGNLVARTIRVNGERLNAVSVHSPAWPVDPARIAAVDTGGIQLALNRDVWIADVLLAGLKDSVGASETPMIVGGDFNLSETFDQWVGGPRGNREYLERMRAFGLTECLRTSRGELTPTFRNASNRKVLHQIDHLFVSRSLAERLVDCKVGEAARVFDGDLSDHLPVIADLANHGGRSLI